MNDTPNTTAETDNTTAAQPGIAAEAPEKHLATHRTAIVAQTDRPIPVAPDSEPVNPNADVSITINKPGEEYLVEGIGSSTKIDFKDVTVESLLAICIHKLEAGAEAGCNFEKNAAADLTKGLAWLKTKVRERLRSLGVTQETPVP